jgi:hypothetical protein
MREDRRGSVILSGRKVSMIRYLIYTSLICILFLPVIITAQDIEPPSEVIAGDTPYDAGGSIVIKWKTPMKEGIEDPAIIGYEILRSTNPDTGFEVITPSPLPVGSTQFTDDSSENGVEYYYKVRALTQGGVGINSNASESAIASMQFYDSRRTIMLIGLILISILILFNIWRASKGVKLYIRPISGLEAVQEAIGRATEMGKPILYVPGIMSMDDIQTIASMAILGRVARMVADYDSQIIVPNIDPLVMTVARETVREAFIDVGRPDAYQEDNISYLTSSQFGYVAGVDGIMVREKPAANFFLGTFYAESLILAETGASTGAIQIAGTAMPSQLPFFVAACDYTLIGEELFAASAYLSREPLMQGSLKGMDWGKILIILFIVVGSILEIFGIDVSSLFFVP